MTVSVDGQERYSWPVSTGMTGYATPSGAFTPSHLKKQHYSREWDNAPMPHSIFFTGDGHAIHGSHVTGRLGMPASHGCVRLAPAHASTLFELVRAEGLGNTRIEVTGADPVGGAQVAGRSGGWRDYRGIVAFDPLSTGIMAGGTGAAIEPADVRKANGSADSADPAQPEGPPSSRGRLLRGFEIPSLTRDPPLASVPDEQEPADISADFPFVLDHLASRDGDRHIPKHVDGGSKHALPKRAQRAACLQSFHALHERLAALAFRRTCRCYEGGLRKEQGRETRPVRRPAGLPVHALELDGNDRSDRLHVSVSRLLRARVPALRWHHHANISRQRSEGWMFLRVLALLLTGLILVPSAAHLFELPGKIGLGRDAYFTVQGIYDGWALFGAPSSPPCWRTARSSLRCAAKTRWRRGGRSHRLC